MKKVIKTSLLLSASLMLAHSLCPELVRADAQEEVKKAAERAVSASISSVLGETVKRMQEVKGVSAPTLFGTPSYTAIDLSDNNLAESSFDLSVDMAQILGGVIVPINDKLFVSGALSYADIAIGTGSGSNSQYANLDASLIAIITSSDALKAWVTTGLTGANYMSDFGDTFTYGGKLGITADMTIAPKFSIQGSTGVNVGDSTKDGSKTSWAGDVEVKFVYQGTDAVKSSLAFGYNQSFVENAKDPQNGSITPAIEFVINEAQTIGVSATYSTLLNSGDMGGMEINSYNAALNYKHKL